MILRPLPDEGLMELFGRLAEALQGATILGVQVFGLVDASAAAGEAMRRVFGKVDWPVTWAEGRACDGGFIAGIQASARAHGGSRA